MNKEIIEYGKRRTISDYDGYSYEEATKHNGNENYMEFLTLFKGDDYSFYYFNGTFEAKVGVFTIESDSIFVSPFLNLIGFEEKVEIVDDYSDRFIEFFKNENGDVEIYIHLLPDETDGSIELKNIMYDIRSRADATGTDLKGRLSAFFDELVELGHELGSNSNTLVKSNTIRF